MSQFVAYRQGPPWLFVGTADQVVALAKLHQGPWSFYDADGNPALATATVVEPDPDLRVASAADVLHARIAKLLAATREYIKAHPDVPADPAALPGEDAALADQLKALAALLNGGHGEHSPDGSHQVAQATDAVRHPGDWLHNLWHAMGGG